MAADPRIEGTNLAWTVVSLSLRELGRRTGAEMRIFLGVGSSPLQTFFMCVESCSIFGKNFDGQSFVFQTLQTLSLLCFANKWASPTKTPLNRYLGLTHSTHCAPIDLSLFCTIIVLNRNEAMKLKLYEQ